MKKGLLGYYDYTVVLTYGGMISAVTGLFFTTKEAYFPAFVCLMIAALCDVFDGMVARTKQRTEDEKNFGIQIDSLCDLVSFGVLPGFLVYHMAGQTVPAAVICIAYMLCALIRLAYFNVLEAARQRATTENRREYLGMPVTPIAGFLPILCLVMQALKISWTGLYLILLGVMGLLFILPFRVKKPHGAVKAVLIALGLGVMLLFILTAVHS